MNGWRNAFAPITRGPLETDTVSPPAAGTDWEQESTDFTTNAAITYDSAAAAADAYGYADPLGLLVF